MLGMLQLRLYMYFTNNTVINACVQCYAFSLYYFFPQFIVVEIKNYETFGHKTSASYGTNEQTNTHTYAHTNTHTHTPPVQDLPLEREQAGWCRQESAPSFGSGPGRRTAPPGNVTSTRKKELVMHFHQRHTHTHIHSFSLTQGTIIHVATQHKRSPQTCTHTMMTCATGLFILLLCTLDSGFMMVDQTGGIFNLMQLSVVEAHLIG